VPTQSTPLRLIADTAADRAPPRSDARLAPRRALFALAALAVLAMVALLLLRATAEERALTRLPPAERAALYQRTLDNVRTVCAGERGRELRGFCRGQAELVLLFPECDGACRATSRELLRTPTR
jgi:cytochrome b pre-mRNA-processing protein 3